MIGWEGGASFHDQSESVLKQLRTEHNCHYLLQSGLHKGEDFHEGKLTGKINNK